MSEALFSLVTKLMTLAGAGTGVLGVASAEKARIVFQGIVVAGLLAAAFVVLYRKYFWGDVALKKLFYASVAILGVFIAGKYALFFVAKGYVPDRLFLYALPSPKANGLGWLVLALVIAASFFVLRSRIAHLPLWKFLAASWLFFAIFGMAVAGIRDSTYGIYEPFTRDQWEYAGDLRLITAPAHFLHDYTSLNAQLSSHGSTHPPGYVLLLYFLQRLFGFGLLGLSIAVGAIGGFAIIPLYFLLKHFFDDVVARRGVMLFMFIPSVVLMSFTSMDAVFMFFALLSLVLNFEGWRLSGALAFVGGIFAAIALFQNFLFLLLAPAFLTLLYGVYASRVVPLKLLVRHALFSFMGFALFFVIVNFYTGYSIIDNFFVARGAQSHAVPSNYASVFMYLTYFVMNIFTFSFGLGVANITLLARRIKEVWSTENCILALGPAMAALLLVIGIFQGELERIWLFLVPLFVVTFAGLLKDADERRVNAMLFVSAAQIFLVQVLFYTYW